VKVKCLRPARDSFQVVLIFYTFLYKKHGIWTGIAVSKIIKILFDITIERRRWSTNPASYIKRRYKISFMSELVIFSN